MKVKYQSHQAANSREFQRGIPGEWPRVEELVDDKLELTAAELAAGFSFVTIEAHKALRIRLQDAYSAWLVTEKEYWASQEAVKETDKQTLLTQVTAIADSSGTLTAAQLSSAVRVLARACLALYDKVVQ